MTPESLLKHFKTRSAIAAAARVSRQAVSKWFKTGLVPKRSAELLHFTMKGRRR